METEPDKFAEENVVAVQLKEKGLRRQGDFDKWACGHDAWVQKENMFHSREEEQKRKKTTTKKKKDALSGKTHDDRSTETINTFVCACALNDL